MCFLSLCGAAAVACSSSGRAVDAGSGPDGKVSGGSTGGTSSEGGHAGSAAGGSSGTVTTGGAGGSSVLDATEVCREALVAQIQRLGDCHGQDQDQLRYHLSAANACPDYAFNPDSSRTVEAVAACLPDLRALTCTDITTGLVPPCLTGVGKRDAGASCAFNSQCKSGLCRDAGSGCKKCEPREKREGETCQNWIDCAPGLHCNGVCLADGTPTYAAEGKPCDLNASPIAGCVGDLYCDVKSGAKVGTCTAPPGSGQPCGGGRFCAPGISCVQGTCRAPGECADGLKCDSSSYCTANLTCAPRPKLGSECQMSTPCLAPGYCLNNAKCVVPRLVGEACDDANPCDRFLLCQKGTCQKINASTCPP